MSLRPLPTIDLRAFHEDDEAGAPDRAVSEFEKRQNVRLLAEAGADTTIEIFGPIGRDPFTGEGVSATDVRERLKGAEAKNITVNINTPGGSWLEANGIYTSLALHKGKVTMNILGTAASAGSLIIMAGDEIRIVENGLVFIHNAQGITMGDRHAHEEAAQILGQIDGSVAGIYARRTGRTAGKISEMMDAETYMFGKDAVKNGFADTILTDANLKFEETPTAVELTPAVARRQLDMALRKGERIPRAVRQRLLTAALGDKPRAVSEPAKQDAGNLRTLADELRAMVPTLK